jgi:hypothetical protein
MNDEFWAHTEPHGDCSFWAGRRNRAGYGHIGYQVLADGVYLSYTVTPYQGTPMPYGYVIPLAWSHLVSGGRRPWWCCPACGRRCGVLYLPPGAGRFACRRCYDLAYASQQDRMCRWLRNPGAYLASTAWGRAVLTELRPPPAPPRLAPAPPGKRPRGRPRTKRKYTRRVPPPSVS